MATAFSDNLGSAATAVTISAATLASSQTVGRQSGVVTLLDANNDVPTAIDVELSFTLSSTAPSGDKLVALFAARSLDGTNFEAGPPNVGTADAAFTFANAPVGSSPAPTDLLLLGQVNVTAASESRRKTFRLFAPPPKLVFVVLNSSGSSLAACALQYRARMGDGR